MHHSVSNIRKVLGRANYSTAHGRAIFTAYQPLHLLAIILPLVDHPDDEIVL